MSSSLSTIKKGKLVENVIINDNLTLFANTTVKFQINSENSQNVDLVFYLKTYDIINYGTYKLIWPNKTVSKTSVQEVPSSPPPPPPPPSPPPSPPDSPIFSPQGTPNSPLPLRL